MRRVVAAAAVVALCGGFTPHRRAARPWAEVACEAVAHRRCVRVAVSPPYHGSTKVWTYVEDVGGYSDLMCVWTAGRGQNFTGTPHAICDS